MKDRYSAQEFRDMLNSGKLESNGKRLKASGSLAKNNTSHIVLSEKAKFEPLFSLSEYIFIPGRVYSSKNNQAIRIKNIGKASKWKCLIKGQWQYVTPFVSKNDNSIGYMKRTAIHYRKNVRQFKDMADDKKKPLIVEFIFVMPDNQGWDFANIVQLVQDCMVKAGMIDDDEVKDMLPSFPMNPVQVFYIDKDNPGVYFKVKAL